MIVDTSAIVAILLGEPDAASLITLIYQDPEPKMSAASLVELHIVAARPDRYLAHRSVDELISKLRIIIAPVTEAQSRVAITCHDRFGRWSGNRAKLNFGDCFSYALSVATGEPLLFVGEDFTHTDISAVRIPGDGTAT